MQVRIKKRYLLIVAGILSIAILLAACGPSPTTGPTPAPTLESAEGESLPAPTSTPPVAPDSADGSYPRPTAIQETVAYPADGQPALPESYPPPVVEEVFKEPRFRLDQPMTANATTVSGQAPPNVALAILDVSSNGELLGTGRSDENGRFTIQVTPLIANNRIGLTVGELAAGQTVAQMAEMYYPYRGEGFMNLPNIGIMFDTALVQP